MIARENPIQEFHFKMCNIAEYSFDGCYVLLFHKVYTDSVN